MAIDYVRRQSDVAPGRNSKPNANPIFVDSDTDELKFGTGASGTSTKTAVTTSGNAPVTVSGTTVTLGSAHVGRTTVLTSTTGCTATLPSATGSGDKYRLVLGAALASGSLVLQVGRSADYFRGFGYTTQDAGGAGIDFPTANTGTLATESDTMTWNRSTTGLGSIGDLVEVEDVAANVWAISAAYNSNGTEATPFSAAV